MTLSLPLLVVALALLWIPRAWLRKGVPVWVWKGRAHHHHRADWQAPAQDGVSLAFRREFTKARNYYDFLRGAAGALAIFGGFGLDAAIGASAGARGQTVTMIHALQSGIVVVGLLIQLVRWERHRLSLSAPVFYIAGVTIGQGLPVAGAAAFALAWALSPVLPSAQSFLTVYAVVVVVVGTVFSRAGLNVAVSATVSFLPVLISLLARRPLVVFSRRGSSSGHQVKS